MFDFFISLGFFLIPLVFILGFIGVWTFIIRLLRRTSRMTDSVPAHAGPRLRKSRWGNATVNGAKATNSIRIEQYASGYAIKLHPVFGGSVAWLPREGLVEERDGEHSVRLQSGGHDVVLAGTLRDFVLDAGSTATAAPAPPTTLAAPVGTPPDGSRVGLATAKRAGSPWARLAMLIVVALLLYVGARRLAPELVAPIEALLKR